MVGMTDRLDQIHQTLKDIRAAVANDSDDDGPDFPGLRPLRPGAWVIVETADLDDDSVNADGTVTVEPGETVVLSKFEPRGGNAAGVLAVGATDSSDVEYGLRVDNTPVGGMTQSPLGTLTSPYSFIEEMRGIVPVEKRVEYIAHRPSSASGSVDLAARMVVEVA